MSKFFVSGPISIFPTDPKLGGMFSYQFICVLLLNTMFGCRVLCIENAFFSRYRLENYGENSWYGLTTNQYKEDTTINPLIPTKYRIAVYLIPSFSSFIINALRIFYTGQRLRQYVRKYPQIMIACCFTPFMFEGCKDNSVRIWKYGSLFNAFFIGCFPQILLLAIEFYRGTVKWDFIGNILYYEQIYESNDSLFKFTYGNIIFAIISGIFFFFLIILTFLTNKVIINHKIFFKIGFKPSLLNGNKPSSTKPQISVSPNLPIKTISASKERETTVDSPIINTKSKHAKRCKIPIGIGISFKNKIHSDKKKSFSDGSVELKKVKTN